MKKVVIIGGGYAGIYALQELVKYKNIKIVLIDKHTFHYLQPEVYDLIANKSNLADVTIDLTTLCQGLNHNYLEFKNLKVRNIDPQAKRIFTQEQETVDFDYLIMAAGTRTFFPEAITGLNNAEDIKKLHRAIFFKQSFENQLFEKISDEVKRCNDTHIVVVGAGLSGVEIAAEMAYNSNKIFKRGNFACDNLKISLISSSDTILPGLSPSLVSMSHKRLKDLGINILTGVKMEKCDESYIYLTNGTKISQSFIVFAGGIEATKITDVLDVKKNGRGQIIVNEYMQSDKYENIFAIGDMAEIKDKKGKILPPNVTVARYSGISTGQNICKMIKGAELKPCYPKLDGILIALGGKYAVGNLYGLFDVKGLPAYFIKKYVFSSYSTPLLKLIKKGYILFNK
ncbi:MAG: FAD-dependent oxidoreductase [Sulfurimonas sp.]|nr:FAD-dependent oxidoreductase [Sulfurimonas sp.]